MSGPTNDPKGRFQRLLERAGYSSPSALQAFVGIKACLMIIGLIAGVGLVLGFYGFTLKGLLAVVLGAGIGFKIPEIVLMILAERKRTSSQNRPLPPQGNGA
jgi:hypothetical protein